MNSLAKFYLKLFIWWAISFGILMQLFDLIDGNAFSLGNFLFRALFFGVFMSLGLGTLHISQLESIGLDNLNAENLGPQQLKIVNSKISKQELINKLKNDPILNKMKLNETESQISLSSKMSWRSWGEFISIKVKQAADNVNEYEISSKPKIGITLIDYGKGLLNVIRIQKLLNNVA